MRELEIMRGSDGVSKREKSEVLIERKRRVMKNVKR